MSILGRTKDYEERLNSNKVYLILYYLKGHLRVKITNIVGVLRFERLPSLVQVETVET